MTCNNKNCSNKLSKQDKKYCNSCVIAHAKMGISLK